MAGLSEWRGEVREAIAEVHRASSRFASKNRELTAVASRLHKLAAEHGAALEKNGDALIRLAELVLSDPRSPAGAED
jgi:hypothetical protein